LAKEEESKRKGKTTAFPRSVLAKYPDRSLGHNYFGTASPAMCEMPSASENLSKYEKVFYE